MSRPTDRRCDRGLTLVEMVVVTAILLILGGAISAMAIRSQDAQTYVERQGRVTTTTQDVAERIRADVGSSLRLFSDDTEGRQYLAGIDRAAWPGLAGARLPRIDAGGTFAKDEVGSEKTGNTLLLAMHDRTDVFDLNQGIGEKDYVRIDVYRLVAYYPRRTPGKDPHADIGGLDLVRWISEPLADRAQVDAVEEETARAALLAHLWAGTNPTAPMLPYPPARLLWQPGAARATAFARVREDGSTEAVPVGFEVPPDAHRTRPGLLGYLKLSVATNRAGSARGIGRFGLVRSAGDGFPHGFETQVVGPASARQVLIHLTVVSNDAGRRRAWLDLTCVAATRDL